MRVLNWSQSADSALAAAIECLQQGGIVALPTDTLYGLAADITNDGAVRRLFEVKKRPLDLPVPILIAASSEAPWRAEMTPLALMLAERFWPGPLTIILNRKPTFNSLALGGKDSVGLRVPDHAVPLAVIGLLGRAITGTSANLSGEPASLTAGDVLKQFEEGVDILIDAGPAPLGAESTVVDLRQERPCLLREGAVGLEELEAVAGIPFTKAES